MNPKARRNPLIEFLQRHRDDRAVLAALRRGLGRPAGAAGEMHPHVARFLPDRNWTWTNQCYYIIAALFGAHPLAAGTGNLGDAFRRVAQARAQRSDEIPESLEKRFVALMKCHREQLPDHLRHIVALAAGSDIPVEWETLLCDIRYWDSDDRRVQRQWAQAFWSSPGPDAGPTEADQQKPETANVGE